MNQDPAKLSLSNFLAGESRDPLQAPPSFTAWMQAGAWAVELYEPELLAGAVLSRCRTEKFEHNDAASLDAALSHKSGRRQLVIIEGIYSMDGDFGKLNELTDVAESHGASVFIDEAHSVLGCGKNGRGAAEQFGVEDRVPLVYGTFSKGFGALGGFVAGSKETLQYLRFYAHPYIYSCALPPVVIAGLLKALEIAIRDGAALRKVLWENADYFHEKLRELGLDTGASTT